MFFFIIAIVAVLAGLIVTVATTLEYGFKRGVIVLIVTIIIVGILMIFACGRVVPTGHTGVVTTFGRVEDYTLDAGINFMAPWKNVVKMDNRIQKETIEMSCFSSDIQEVKMVYTLNYQIAQDQAMTIYSTIGKNYYEKVIQPTVQEASKIVTALYTAENLVGSRNELSVAIEKEIASKLAQYNILVSSTSIEDMDFTDAFTSAVEAKQVAAQNKQKAENEAAQKIVEAEAAAEVRRINAEAEAYEVMTKAEAEAEANRKIAESLTNELINYTYANLWNGELPTYMGGESSIPVFQTGPIE